MKILIFTSLFFLNSFAHALPCLDVEQIDSSFQATWDAWLAVGGRAEDDGPVIDACLILLDPDNATCVVSQNSRDLCQAFSDI